MPPIHPKSLMHLHHLKTLVIITRPAIRVPILSLALAIHLPTAMRPRNLEKALPLGLEHGLGRIVVPSVYEVPMETEPVADLLQVQPVSNRLSNLSLSK